MKLTHTYHAFPEDQFFMSLEMWDSCITEVISCILLFILFTPFYWAEFVAQRERAQRDFKVPYKVPHLTHPPFTYERQPQHWDHPTLIRIVRGFFYRQVIIL